MLEIKLSHPMIPREPKLAELGGGVCEKVLGKPTAADFEVQRVLSIWDDLKRGEV